MLIEIFFSHSGSGARPHDTQDQAIIMRHHGIEGEGSLIAGLQSASETMWQLSGEIAICSAHQLG